MKDKFLKKADNLSRAEQRRVSNERAEELKGRIDEYLRAREEIVFADNFENDFFKNRDQILEVLNADLNDWNNWHWQLQNRIDSVELLQKIFDITESEAAEIKEVEQKYRWAVSPYFLALIDWEDKDCPIRKQAIPTLAELEDQNSLADPMAEKLTNPAGAITRRYPDRLIINLSNVCASFCRHCQRRRAIGQVDRHCSKKKIEESIDYIRKNEEIRDVLLTGGDPLTMGNQRLEEILSSLRKIEHVEIIRIGSRVPITMPQRITDKLISMLKKFHPLYINLQINHPKELTRSASKAISKLADTGIPLGNQAVLLKGINDNPHLMKALNQKLLKVRVKPYYIFHAKRVIGTGHFRTPVDAGIEIMEYLRGYTSGMAIPQFIVNAPLGLGKTPINPQYIISRGPDYLVLRTWEGKIVKYKDR